MGKAGFLTAKAVANRIKSKGLQKLRWFCQMCQKQCRDDNGFKCHTMSESHQRQLLLVAENPSRFVDQFSNEFETAFVRHIRTRFNTRRVKATTAYNDYIQDKEHLHMNSTKWHTLTEFVKYLGREGICEVDETPKGWFMAWVDRDPESIRRQKLAEKQDRLAKDEDERQAKLIKAQIERDRAAAAARGEDVTQSNASELKRGEDGEKIGFSLGAAVPIATKDTSAARPATNVLKGLKTSKDDKSHKEKKSGDNKRKLTNIEQLRLDIEAKKLKSLEATKAKDEEASSNLSKKSSRKDYWLYTGIVVKIMNKSLKDGKYHKQKAVVQDVVDKYVGTVKLVNAKTILKLDQEYLETVIPAIGGDVLVVNGEYRGYRAELLKLDIDNFCATVELKEGPYKNKVVDKLPYEDICKLA